MVQITILIMSLSLALLLIITGFYDYKHGDYLKLSGFVILFFVGLLTLISPIEIKSGEIRETHYQYSNNFTVEDNHHWYMGVVPTYNPASLNDPATIFLFHEENTISYVYTENNNLLNAVFGILLILVGLYGIIRSATDMGEESDKLL